MTAAVAGGCVARPVGRLDLLLHDEAVVIEHVPLSTHAVVLDPPHRPTPWTGRTANARRTTWRSCRRAAHPPSRRVERELEPCHRIVRATTVLDGFLGVMNYRGRAVAQHVKVTAYALYWRSQPTAWLVWS